MLASIGIRNLLKELNWIKSRLGSRKKEKRKILILVAWEVVVIYSIVMMTAMMIASVGWGKELPFLYNVKGLGSGRHVFMFYSSLFVFTLRFYLFIIFSRSYKFICIL